MPSSRNCLISREAFVDHGFDCWKNAVKAFDSHEKGQFHREACQLLINAREPTVFEQISSSKQREMADARTALSKMFTSVRFLASQGLALRGHDDEHSNLMQLLKMRAEDVPELGNWLSRSGYTWTSHDSINDILHLMANSITRQHMEAIKSAEYFAIMADETADVSNVEQVSICIRIVSEEFMVSEIFMGFYQTDDTRSESLFRIIQDVLIRLNLDISKVRGQCFDGARNVSGKLSGLQARIRDIEPRALFVHCFAHSLNLMVQDALEGLPLIRNFIGIIKELINFIRDSPKRVAFFKQLQAAINTGSPLLSPFCPTRY